MEKIYRKNGKNIYHNRKERLLSHDEKLKNWNVDSDVFNELEIELSHKSHLD